MPAKSEAQRRAAGMALALKRGEIERSEVGANIANMASSMSQSELRDFARRHKRKKKS